MLTTLAIEFLVIFILVVINGLLSMSELSIISSRKARLRKLIASGDRKAAKALELSENPDRMLSTVQVGITLMGILSGAFGGATLSTVLGDLFESAGLSETTAEFIAFVIVVLAITYLSLVIGELVPKRIALHNPEAAARQLAGPVHWLSRLVSPAVSLLSISTRAILKLFGISAMKASSVTEEEVQMLMEEGTKTGVFEEEELSMVGSIFRMSDLGVKDIMTPRTDIDWLDVNSTTETILEAVKNSPHSFFPVGEGSIDESLGVVKSKDILHQLVSTSSLDLRSILREAAIIPESSSAFDVMEVLRKAKTPIALVIDEYGGLDGLVTLTDLLSTIVGGVSATQETPAVVRRDDGSWLIDAMLPFEDFRELVGQRFLPREEQTFRTVAGFILSRFGRIPKVSEGFELSGYRIEVLDLDGRRIDKVLVVPLDLPPEG